MPEWLKCTTAVRCSAAVRLRCGRQPLSSWRWDNRRRCTDCIWHGQAQRYCQRGAARRKTSAQHRFRPQRDVLQKSAPQVTQWAELRGIPRIKAQKHEHASPAR